MEMFSKYFSATFLSLSRQKDLYLKFNACCCQSLQFLFFCCNFKFVLLIYVITYCRCYEDGIYKFLTKSLYYLNYFQFLSFSKAEEKCYQPEYYLYVYLRIITSSKGNFRSAISFQSISHVELGENNRNHMAGVLVGGLCTLTHQLQMASLLRKTLKSQRSIAEGKVIIFFKILHFLFNKYFHKYSRANT